MTPNDCYFTKSHEWVKILGTTATIGITDHAQEALGDITFVEFPKIGAILKKGGQSGVVESVKAASDIYSPVSGTVVEVNESLETSPESVNSDPYTTGWLFKLANVNPADAVDLMDAESYNAFATSEK